MDVDIYNFSIAIALCIYISVVSLFTKEFYKIVYFPVRFKTHLYFALAIAAIGLYKIILPPDLLLGDLYFCMPLFFLCLIKLADKWTMDRHNRHIIRATNSNMASKETEEAKLSDYVFFMVVNFGPIFIPILIYENILGYSF